jgi:hypothetical protein
MRPRDEDGVLLPPPHVRLEQAPDLRQAAVIAMSRDARACALTTARKVTIANKAIDHVVDGDAVPKWAFTKDEDRPDNHFQMDIWKAAKAAVLDARGAARE